MSHEPECESSYAEPADCTCFWLRRAFQRGYTAGYNDPALAAQHWQDTHGAYQQHGVGLEHP